AATVVLHRRRRPIADLLWIAATFGLLEIALPPVHHPWMTRVAFGIGAFAGVALLGLGMGRAALRSVPGVALAAAIVSTSIWARQLAFYSLPGEGARSRVAATAGVSLVELPELPLRVLSGGPIFTADPPRFLLEDCDGSH